MNTIHQSVIFQPDNFSEDQRVLNTHIIIDSSGAMKATYSKVHLFNVAIKGGLRLQETDFTIPGKKITPPVDTPVGKLGLSIVSLIGKTPSVGLVTGNLLLQ